MKKEENNMPRESVFSDDYSPNENSNENTNKDNKERKRSLLLHLFPSLCLQ